MPCDCRKRLSIYNYNAYHILTSSLGSLDSFFFFILRKGYNLRRCLDRTLGQTYKCAVLKIQISPEVLR